MKHNCKILQNNFNHIRAQQKGKLKLKKAT